MVCAVALALGVSNCSFPDYGRSPDTAGSAGGGGEAVLAGGAGTGGLSVGGADQDGGVDDAGAAGDRGGAGTAGGGSGGEAGAAGGSGGEPCLFPTPVVYPAHCFNRSLGDGETGTDCGGSECAPCSSTQACVQDSDCVSQRCGSDKSCIPVISLTYTPIDVSATTRMPKFKLNLTYLDTTSMSLPDLTIRYYYNHNSVAEPIGVDSQATIDPGNSQTDISNKVLASLHRFPPGPVQNGIRTDSYLEIAFDKAQTVTTGTKFVITQDFVAGSSDPLFDQYSHYSFVKSATAVANEAVVVYRAGERIWGVEPPLALFPECAFAAGVNMNGPELTVSGEALAAESDASLTFSGGAVYANSAKPVPTTDLSTASLLSTARTLNTGDSATWSVPNGKYWAYAWLTSAANADSGTLVIGQSVADEFVRPNVAGVRWGLLGPYRVDVVANSLTFTVEGVVHLAGVKLYAVER